MEIFKDIKGYEGIYQVSNLGTVKSLDHFIKTRYNGRRLKKGRILKTSICKKGYIRVSLSKDVIRFQTGVHRLIAIAFIPNIENKPQINHINGIKTDNCIENLEWCTNKENKNHAVKNGLVKFNYGENHHMSKLTNKQSLELKSKFKNGYSVINLAKEYKISTVTVYKIIKINFFI